MRHRLVLSFVADLPFGEGRKFGPTSGVVGKLISGWTLNGVMSMQSGFPLAFLASPNLIGYGYGSATAIRPNVDPNCDKSVSGSPIDRLDNWFNTSCFTVPNAGFVASDPSTNPGLRWALGNAERVDPDLRGHAVNNWNFAVSKTTPIQGRVNLSLRFEAFNLFNRTQFGPPDTTATTAATSTFGKVTRQLNQPRLIQLAFRLMF